MNIASFTPITLTAETVSQLIREGHIDSMTLYVAYAEISSWQDTKKVMATTEFMKKRLKWGEVRFLKAKKILVEKKLVSNMQSKGKDGRITGNYIFVNYLVSTPPSNRGVGEWGSGFQGDKCLITKTKVLNNLKQVPSEISEEIVGEEFSQKKYFDKMRTNTHPHIRFILWYFEETGLNFPSLKAVRKEVKRWLKDASVITEYDSDSVEACIGYVKREFPDKWNISTINKYIAKF